MNASNLLNSTAIVCNYTGAYGAAVILLLWPMFEFYEFRNGSCMVIAEGLSYKFFLSICSLIVQATVARPPLSPRSDIVISPLNILVPYTTELRALLVAATRLRVVLAVPKFQLVFGRILLRCYYFSSSVKVSCGLVCFESAKRF